MLIENGQHWVPDVVFGENSWRQQDRNVEVNFAAALLLDAGFIGSSLMEVNRGEGD